MDWGYFGKMYKNVGCVKIERCNGTEYLGRIKEEFLEVISLLIYYC